MRPQYATIVTPGYFELLGIPLLHGRTLTERDVSAPGGDAARVIVVSESLARDLFGEVNVVGRTVEFATRSRAGEPFEIVGVVGDARYNGFATDPEPMLYEPAGLDMYFFGQEYILLRLRGESNVNDIVRRVADELDASLPVRQVFSMDEAIAEDHAAATFMARLVGVLAVVAAGLAAVGLYGVVSFGVSTRTREFGVRIALGATPGQVFGIVVRGVAGLAAVGLGLGLAGSVGFVRVLDSYLYGVAPSDPLSWLAAAVGLTVVALLAAWLPARRATRVDPVKSLRAS